LVIQSRQESFRMHVTSTNGKEIYRRLN